LIKDPDAIIKDALQNILDKVIKKLGLSGKALVLEITKKAAFGDLCTPVFQIAKENKKNPMELAKEIAEIFPKDDIITNVTSEGGFVNYTLERGHYSKIVLDVILSNEKFFVSEIYKNQKMIVEHTSANPNGPIHIGNFRGSIIGDSYARILKTVGAEVRTHFYVDDLGHQVPICVIGYDLLKRNNLATSKVKIDHFLGQIYGITHTMLDIQKLKQDVKSRLNLELGKNPYWLQKEEAELLKTKDIPADMQKGYKNRFDFYLSIQNDIYKRFKSLYDNIKNCLEKEQIDLSKAVPDLNRKYQEQEKNTVKIVRATCEDAIRGHKEELGLLGITFDKFDWEADLQWSGKVFDALAILEKNGFVIKDGKARLFESNKAANLKGAREYLNLKKTYEVPNGMLITSIGDTLYLLRDIPYSLEKIDQYNSDKVFNVIGKPQELTQIQLNLALRALDRSDAANKMWHLNYEYMELKGALTRMSARRLQYITPLDLYMKTKEAVLESFLKERDYPEEEKEEIAKIVAVGAIKYSIIAVGLMKKLIFDPQEVISLNNNTSPFIQYAFARSQNILAKTEFKWKKTDQETLAHLQEEEEWLLIQSLVKLPQIIRSAAAQIKPELICNYLFDVAILYNKFYDNHRVLDATTKELIQARLALTYATGLVLSSGLQILGIDSPKRM
jgi:arginyl-tRNA synthetase